MARHDVRIHSAAAAAALALLPAAVALASVETSPMQTLAEAAGTARMLPGAASLHLRFVQEDGPESGHVRVLLTPDARRLTAFEARSAAQQAFLEALNEPGLGEALSRITIVVRLSPEAAAGPTGPEEVFLFLHKGGREWSILRGE